MFLKGSRGETFGRNKMEAKSRIRNLLELQWSIAPKIISRSKYTPGVSHRIHLVNKYFDWHRITNAITSNDREVIFGGILKWSLKKILGPYLLSRLFSTPLFTPTDAKKVPNLPFLALQAPQKHTTLNPTGWFIQNPIRTFKPQTTQPEMRFFDKHSSRVWIFALKSDVTKSVDEIGRHVRRLTSSRLVGREMSFFRLLKVTLWLCSEFCLNTFSDSNENASKGAPRSFRF